MNIEEYLYHDRLEIRKGAEVMLRVHPDVRPHLAQVKPDYCTFNAGRGVMLRVTSTMDGVYYTLYNAKGEKTQIVNQNRVVIVLKRGTYATE